MDVGKLEALEGLTDEADALAGPTPEQVQQQTETDALEDQARQWGMVAFTVGGALGMLAPELRQVYTEDACMGWGRAMVPVAEKYGWSGPGNCPELGLLAATAGLAVPSFMAVRARLEQLKRARELEAKAKGKADAQAVAEAPTSGG